MVYDDYDGFGVRIQEEGSALTARFIELPEISASGATLTDALIELKHVWDEAKKDIYRKAT